MRNPMPAGFRRSIDSGLIVPEEQSRLREVWTRDDWKLLNRAATLFSMKGLSLLLKCNHPGCKDQPVEKIHQPDGGFILRCAHCDRVFQKNF